MKKTITLLPICFHTFYLGIDFTTLKMTLNLQNNTINELSGQNPMKKEVLHMFLALLVKNDIFAYITLKLTFRP